MDVFVFCVVVLNGKVGLPIRIHTHALQKVPDYGFPFFWLKMVTQR